MTAIQTNVEYWFRLLYECLYGSCYGSVDASQFLAWLAHLWVWITLIGYILAVIALIVIIYTTMRLFELRHREEEHYSTLIPMPGSKSASHPRWEHIKALAAGASASEWREAIIEADILLDEVLTERGYVGEALGEKLKTADRSSFRTLDEAWEAHKVRNDIAHRGSEFQLSEMVARRTISRYEAVFREFKVI